MEVGVFTFLLLRGGVLFIPNINHKIWSGLYILSDGVNDTHFGHNFSNLSVWREYTCVWFHKSKWAFRWHFSKINFGHFKDIKTTKSNLEEHSISTLKKRQYFGQYQSQQTQIYHIQQPLFFHSFEYKKTKLVCTCVIHLTVLKCALNDSLTGHKLEIQIRLF